MFKNIALAIITIISLPIILTWEIVTKKEFIFLIVGIVIGYLYGSDYTII
tara:strand:+ start:176 stop:325 length:150 start_codon:yes stop_codon:yes gene_type:complete